MASGRVWRGKGGREGAGRVTAGKAQSQENESLMTRMQEGTILSTQAQEGGTEELGEGGGRFNTQVGSKNWRCGGRGGRGGRGNSKEPG